MLYTKSTASTNPSLPAQAIHAPIFKELFTGIADILKTPKNTIGGIVRYLVSRQPYIRGAELDLTNLCQRPGFCCSICTYGLEKYTIEYQFIKADQIKALHLFIESINSNKTKPQLMLDPKNNLTFTKYGNLGLTEKTLNELLPFFTEGHDQGQDKIKYIHFDSNTNGLPIEKAKQMIDALATLKKETGQDIPLRLSGGGEPLLYRNKEHQGLILELLKYATSPERNITNIMIITNGQIYKELSPENRSWLTEILKHIKILRISNGNALNNKGEDYLDSDLKKILQGIASCLHETTTKPKILLQYLLLPDASEKKATQALHDLDTWLKKEGNIPEGLSNITTEQVKPAQEMREINNERKLSWPYDKFEGAYAYLHYEQENIKMSGRKLYSLLLQNISDSNPISSTSVCHGADFFVTIGYDAHAYSCCDMKYQIIHRILSAIHNDTLTETTINDVLSTFALTAAPDMQSHMSKACFFACVLTAINHAIDRLYESFIASLYEPLEIMIDTPNIPLLSNIFDEKIYEEIKTAHPTQEERLLSTEVLSELITLTQEDKKDEAQKLASTIYLLKDKPIIADDYYKIAHQLKTLCLINPLVAYRILDHLYEKQPKLYLGSYAYLFYLLYPHQKYNTLLQAWQNNNFTSYLDATQQLLDGFPYNTKTRALNEIIDLDESIKKDFEFIKVRSELDRYRTEEILKQIQNDATLMTTLQTTPIEGTLLNIEETLELSNSIMVSLYTKTENRQKEIQHKTILFHNNSSLTPWAMEKSIGITIPHDLSPEIIARIISCEGLEYNPIMHYLTIRASAKNSGVMTKLFPTRKNPEANLPNDLYNLIETTLAELENTADQSERFIEFVDPATFSWQEFFPKSDYTRLLPMDAIAILGNQEG